MARAAGVILDWQDIADLSDATPLMARVYPNGLADVNHFHAAGGLGYMIGELAGRGPPAPRHPHRRGHGLALHEGAEARRRRAHLGRRRRSETLNDKVLRPASDPFQKTGGSWNSPAISAAA
jgi:phosphogluconate dehydratase